MEECRACGTAVQFQLVNHKFFGFKAGCDRWKAFQQEVTGWKKDSRSRR